MVHLPGLMIAFQFKLCLVIVTLAWTRHQQEPRHADKLLPFQCVNTKEPWPMKMLLWWWSVLILIITVTYPEMSVISGAFMAMWFSYRAEWPIILIKLWDYPVYKGNWDISTKENHIRVTHVHHPRFIGAWAGPAGMTIPALAASDVLLVQPIKLLKWQLWAMQINCRIWTDNGR